MPARRKNAEIGRLKRSVKKGKLCDYLSPAYMQYILIFALWGILLLINQSTEMRFEYFWPGWLFIRSIHDSVKLQGLQYTIVFILIVIAMDSVCFLLFPASWIYSCGSAYVWAYLLWYTDQGLCFLTLTLCFIFVYFELGFYSKEAKFNQSIYLFRPFAAHSIGYPVVCMGYSLKGYLESRNSKYKKMVVRQQNSIYFRILRDAIAHNQLSDCSGGASPSIYLPDDVSDHFDYDCICSSDGSGKPLPWSLFLFQQMSKSLRSQFLRWTACTNFLSKECNGISTHNHTCHVLQRHPGSNNNSVSSLSNGQVSSTTGFPLLSDGTTRRAAAITSTDVATSASTCVSLNRRCANSDNPSDNPHVRSKPPSSSKQLTGRPAKEDLNTRLENSIRRLRADVQSMRAVESQLRIQLAQLEHDDRVNRVRLADQRQHNESLANEVTKLLTQSRAERANLQSVECNLADEVKLREALESQLNLGTSGQVEKEQSLLNTAVKREPDQKDTTSHLDDQDPGIIKFIPPSPSHIIDDACCQRRRLLESEVFSLRLSVKRVDDQLRVLSAAGARQGNPQQLEQRHVQSGKSCSSEDASSLETQVQHAMLESERLNNTLRQENWMKQELLTSYHNSVREINDLNKTHKQRDFQILELTMKIEQLERFTRADRYASSNKPKLDQPNVRPDRSVPGNKSGDCGPYTALNSSSATSWTTSPPYCSGIQTRSGVISNGTKLSLYASAANGVTSSQCNEMCSDVVTYAQRSSPVGCYPRIETETR